MKKLAGMGATAWTILMIAGILIIIRSIFRIIISIIYSSYLSEGEINIYEILFGIILIIVGIIIAIFSYKKMKETTSKYEKLQEDIAVAENKGKELPKTYDYYCPHCLHQTNRKLKMCPQCGDGKLLKT